MQQHSLSLPGTPLTGGIVRRDTALADGRELFYYDDADTTLGPERAHDTRELPARPDTASMRRDALTGEWVSIATARQGRPVLPPAEADPLAPQSPGNPSEIPSMYDVAVFENRSPAFGPGLGTEGLEREAGGVTGAGLEAAEGLTLGAERLASGRCEVICFSPALDGSLGGQSDSRVRTVIEALADRTAALSALPGVAQVFPFENRGAEIGVTLPHPHGQIYGYPFVTPRTRALLREVEAHGPAFFDRLLAFEQSSERLVFRGAHWSAFVPFAARWPVELHLLPHRQVPDLAATTEDERAELSTLYPRLLRAVDALYETPTPYIAAWHQAPVGEGRDSVRLRLEITSPRRAADKLKYLAGSEAAMGAWVADLSPEDGAKRLREALASTSTPSTSAGGTEPPHHEQEANAARQAFVALTGRAPDGLWFAPGRVNLIGEHTDYSEGFVLPFAIAERAYAAAGRRTDGIARVTSTHHSAQPVEIPVDALESLLSGGRDTGPTAGPIEASEWARYPLGVAGALLRQARQEGRDVSHAGGFDLALSSAVPLGAGLSSSAAIECATATALNDLWGLGFDRTALAEAGRTAENEAVGAPTGIMDQMAAMHGTAGSAVFLDCRSLEVQHVPFDIAAAGLSLIVIDTRVKHSHSTGAYGERRAACERAAAALGLRSLRDATPELVRTAPQLDPITRKRAQHVVSENGRVLEAVAAMRAHGPQAIGTLLTASHASLRDDFEVSCPELDLAVDVSLGAGALGARMTGGGFGGCAIALAETPKAAALRLAVEEAFLAAGYGLPSVFAVRPFTGAGRAT